MTPRSKSGPAQPPRLRPMILFLMLTLMTFGGPLAIVIVGRGGARPSWPPDRPIEWWVLGGVTTGYLILLTACVLDASLTLKRTRIEKSRANSSEGNKTGDETSEAPR